MRTQLSPASSANKQTETRVRWMDAASRFDPFYSPGTSVTSLRVFGGGCLPGFRVRARASMRACVCTRVHAPACFDERLLAL